MTSKKVFEFLNDSGGNNFTESAPRPPVPGEENELHSNGGMSTRSSGSHKSQVSSKSQSSGKSMSSSKGEMTHSPAATPRKSNLDKTGGSLSCSTQGLFSDDMDAPLGFEPEGSAASSPPFTENSTPPHLKWAETLHHLLSDSDGVELFKEYLEKESGGCYEVDFWFACEGLRQKDEQQLPSVIKVIYKKFVRHDKIKCIDKDTRQGITDKINRKEQMDRTIFDSAQAEVEGYMKGVTYPAFLNSDFYVQYVQNYGDSPKSSRSSGSNSARPVSQAGLLPALIEDKELESDQLNYGSVSSVLNKSHGHNFQRPELPGARRTETLTGCSRYTSRMLNSAYPAHVSYAPVSTVDSELQSLSSDALTDDTISLTDSSVDGLSNRSWKRSRKSMKNQAQVNRETSAGLHSHIIPRTERAPKDRNIAETDPKKFASLVIEKLKRVYEEQEIGIKMEEKLKCLEYDKAEEEKMSSSMVKNTTASFNIPFIPSNSVIEDETAESILDQHCSRIWASSSHHTPSGHSPPNKSPTVARKKFNQSLPATGTGSSGIHSRSLQHRKRDCLSSLSCDSGVGDEKSGKETHKHIHHHHHHHHQPRTSKTRMEKEAQHASMSCWTDALGQGNRSVTSKKKASKCVKSSDSSSYIDSGISTVYDKESLPPMPNLMDPTSSKVLSWMLESDRVAEPSSGYQDSDKSSSNRKSHAARLNHSASASLPSHKQGSKKVCGTHTNSRSTSVERSGNTLQSWIPPSQVMPSQPFAQDTMMPLPPHPNTRTQLEEAKRRLEDYPGSPIKSKSFTGVSKGHTMQSCSSQVRTMPSAKTVPSDLDRSGSQTLDRSVLSNKSNSANVSTSSSNTTVIGIYFGTEPIPYRHTLPGRNITLGQFKTLITKKGNFKYFFKTDSDEFGGEGAVFEQISDDNAVLPMWENKIVAKVDKIE
ncbi:hypothetical protein SNE40_005707 [Patella caerulea]|uniref:Axin n=1 Tax=Patella caerulea TaxID=87958 RepID=A0AAN8K2B1_PATCE